MDSGLGQIAVEYCISLFCNVSGQTLVLHFKLSVFVRLSLCDLAGSERYQKTGTGNDRLKEASVINTSLMTLSRCIEILRTNQGAKYVLLAGVWGRSCYIAAAIE